MGVSRECQGEDETPEVALCLIPCKTGKYLSMLAKSLKEQMKNGSRGFPDGPVVKSLPCNAEVPSRMWEDPTCHGATKPMGPQLLKPMC